MVEKFVLTLNLLQLHNHLLVQRIPENVNN